MSKIKRDSYNVGIVYEAPAERLPKYTCQSKKCGWHGSTYEHHPVDPKKVDSTNSTVVITIVECYEIRCPKCGGKLK